MPTLALPLWECQRGAPARASDRIDGVDLDAFRWLLTDDGHALLEAATTVSGGDELAAQRTLRQQASPDRVAAALTQVELRRRGRVKFGDLATRMFFTPDGLEQATRLPVAR